MFSRTSRWLIVIVIVFAAALWVAVPNTGLHVVVAGRSIDWSAEVHQGLDLQGGLQVLLEADVPANQMQSGFIELR